MSKNFAILEKKNKKNLAPGALARVHVKQGSDMTIKRAFIVKTKETIKDNQLQLFPLVLVYIIHSNTMQHIYESQVLEILSLPV